MGCTCKSPIVAFLLLTFVVSPLICWTIALMFGSILAAVEGWWIQDGMWYVVCNIAGAPPVSPNSPLTAAGIAVDVIVSTGAANSNRFSPHAIPHALYALL